MKRSFFVRESGYASVRPRAALLLLLAILLAGCADEPEPMAPIEGTLTEDARPMPGRPVAPLAWATVLEEGLLLSPATPVTTSASIPNGSIQVLVNATLDAGAAQGLTVRLGDCVWRRDLAFVGTGQTIGADCGGVTDGATSLVIETAAGALQGKLVVAALVCNASQGVCPARLPVTSE